MLPLPKVPDPEEFKRIVDKTVGQIGIFDGMKRSFLTGVCLDVRDSVPLLPNSSVCQTDMRFGRFSGSSTQMGP